MLNNNDSFVCILKSEKEIYKIGEKPELNIEIINKTDSSVILVGSLDGSDIGWRLPFCMFSVKHQIFGYTSKYSFGCANVNNFREKDFVEVATNSGFNPYEHIDDMVFFSSYQIQSDQFWIPGNYQIFFIYSTLNNDSIFWSNDKLLSIDSTMKEWYFEQGREQEYYHELKHINKLDSLWNLVPKMDIVSNPITIKYRLF